MISRFSLTRRTALRAGAVLIMAPGCARAETKARSAIPAGGSEAGIESHGLSTFGDLAQKPDFTAFGYVNRAAPKGGMVGQEMYGTFNSLNAYVMRGDPATGMSLIFDSLMTGSLDERDALYGLVAKSVWVSPDRRTYRFRLRKEARFHDGSPLTANDVVFSLNTLKTKGHPTIRVELRDMEKAVAEAEDVVTVTLAATRSREAPLVIARQPIFSAAYYASHPFEESTLDPPLGSSAYKVGRFEQGRYITFDRVKDYWGKDLPVNVGQANFDVVRFDYFADRPVAFEAFKSGAFPVHEEFTAANWATAYDFPAFRDGRVKREEIPDENISGIQGWFFNLRRPQFKDARVREAIGACFDFVWTNRNLMYGSYIRTQSFFENSDMKAKGPPDDQEKALLEPFRGKLPEEVFREPFVPPVSDGSGQDRALLKHANDLLNQAGCKRVDGSLMLPDGKPFEIEFLDFSNTMERHTQPYVKNLGLLGINARLRVVDPAQYRQRLENFDFDMMVQRLVMSFSPGEELRALFGSDAARMVGSRNMTGISDPVVDGLISNALVASSRDELIHICRALDRVLRAQRIWVPHWYKANHWIAHWDVFGRPAKSPRYDPGILSTWWWDADRAKQINYPAG
jgi:microcin C transport system substrate-binding protein